MRLLHPPERSQERDAERFDPVAEGARHRLSASYRARSGSGSAARRSIAAGRRDDAQARLRFHEFATRFAARGGRLLPDIGRVTRVETEHPDAPREGYDAWSDSALSRAPGRDTLVAAEARRH